MQIQGTYILCFILLPQRVFCNHSYFPASIFFFFFLLPSYLIPSACSGLVPAGEPGPRMEYGEDDMRQRELIEDFRERLIRSYGDLVLVQEIDSSSLASEPVSVDRLYVPVSILTYHDAKQIMGQHKEITLEKLDAASKKGLAEHHTKARQLNLESLLENQNGLRVRASLVIGNGGSGKTLTCAKIISEWMSQRAFQRFKLVVHVSGRRSEMVHANNEAELLGLEEMGYSKEQQADIVNYVKRNSREVLFIIDGADEVRGGGILDPGKTIARLLQSGSRTLSSFIIMTRPCPESYDLLNVCKAHFCLVGLTDHNLSNLVAMHLGEQRSPEFLARVEDTSMAHIKALIQDTPLFASMMVQLYKEEGQVLPNTITDLFESMHRLVFERFRMKDAGHDDTRVSQLSDFAGLEELAYQGMIEGTFAFNENRVSQCCPDHCLRLGLLNEMRKGCRVFTFYHLFWQEFLAARHIRSRQNIFKLLQACVETVGVGEHTWQFWKFVAAFLPQCHLPELVIQLKAKAVALEGFVPGSTKFACFLCACLAEAVLVTFNRPNQNSACLEMAVKLIWPAVKPYLNDHCLSTVEAKAFSTALSALSDAADGFTVSKCFFTENCWQQLLGQRDKYRKLGIFHSGVITETTMVHVSHALSQFATLCIEGTSLQGRTVEILSRAAIAKNYSEIAVRGCGLHSDHLHQMLIATGRKNWLGLLKLVLQKGDFGASECSQALKAIVLQMPNLEKLNLRENNLNDGHILQLLDGLDTHQQLQELNLAGNHLTCDALRLISRFAQKRHRRMGFQQRQMKLTIEISANNISLADTLEAGKSIPHDSDVHLKFANVVVSGRGAGTLDIPRMMAENRDSYGEVTFKNAGGDLVASEIAAFLETDSATLFLDLLRSFIGDTGVKDLSAMLLMNTTLKGLGAEGNHITEEGLKALLSSLLHNQSMQIVNIGNNPIFSQFSMDQVSLRGCSRLSIQPSLQVLCLSATEMTNTVLKNWSYALFAELSLITLDLSDNLISDEGVGYIMEHLGESRNLRLLSLSGNCLTDRGANLMYTGVNETRTAYQGQPTCTILLGQNRVSDGFFSNNESAFIQDDALSLSERSLYAYSNFTAKSIGTFTEEERLSADVAATCLSGKLFFQVIQQLRDSGNYETVDMLMLRCLKGTHFLSMTQEHSYNLALLMALWAMQFMDSGDAISASRVLCQSLLIIDQLLVEGAQFASLNEQLQGIIELLLANVNPDLPSHFAEVYQVAIGRGQRSVAEMLLQQSSYILSMEAA